MKSVENFIEKIINFSPRKKLPANFDKKNFAKFVKVFYSDSKLGDFVNYSTESLFNSALTSFNLFVNRKPLEIKTEIVNPGKDDFKSPYSFLNIVNDDMPFLVDSTVAYLDKYGIRVKNILHPIYSVIRDKNGKLKEICYKNEKGSKQESVIHLYLDKVEAESDLKMLKGDIEKILTTVALVVKDFKPMVNVASDALKQIDNAKKFIKDEKEISEIKEFISWIIDKSFIFLGAKEFDIKKNKKGEHHLVEVKGSSFGIFNSNYEDMIPQVVNSSIEEISDSIANPYVIEVLKSRYRSRIHRTANAERIRIQKFSSKGEVIGEFRFIGLFTSAAYHDSVNSIPLLRDKISKVIADSGYIKGSHNYKDLVSTLESYPRDELFQISTKDLLKNAAGIVAICGRSQVKFFARKDKFKRFVSCLILVPRDRGDSELHNKIKEYLSQTYDGEIADSFMQITESNLTRFHIIVRTDGSVPKVDEAKIERDISKMARVWSDDLREAIASRFDDERRISLFAKYRNSFSVSYINRFDPRRAAIDISRIEQCLENDLPLFNLYKSSEILPDDVTELKIYSPNREIILSAIMPILESFGFNVIQEHTYTISIENDDRVRTKQKVWIHYFHLNLSNSGNKFSEKTKLNFEKTISLIWNQVTKAGFLNRLIISSGLSWKQVYMLRAYRKYLYQSGFRYNDVYLADVLVKHGKLTKLLVGFFEAKFDVWLKLNDKERQKRIEEISSKIKSGLNQIKDPIEDIVIRKFFGVIDATLRTNYYQFGSNGNFKGYISFKFDCKKVPDLPLPLPHTEIFVYSPRFEAVHLRGGKVARGGLRWSDRQEDFRTEILGLMKAQMTKNAVIVPVGSKGGFVIKKDVTGLSRDEIQKEAIECYKMFLSGLLDITDNVVNGKIEHPKNVVMHDESDPYLVVAADKGTATFSDIANSVSANYNFWLGDAFASGGSVGYDHKKMGITARGAWVSVMRHFHELGVDIQKEAFTCVGVGDMSGDVFGNGMLLSKHTKLIAAFNHMHIFLDPNPDVAKSFAERKRLFNLPRSTWLDYDSSLISKGGGIFDRKEKTIKLSSEIKEVLAIEENELKPDALIKAILKSPVDLLWNGGIGTYVKSVEESDLEVGDRANDAVRVNGSDLRVKVIGEGGNLGLTQKGRIEYALATGGAVNTDAMDNSAGVDCSDHEVNIKIALTAALRDKKITMEKRNKILESMTDEVAELVLNDNSLQTQAISIAKSQGIASLDDQAQFLSRLEKSGALNREIEFLPSKKEIANRHLKKTGLTRPELCVMLAYSKMDIYSNLLSSSLVKDKYFADELFSYFPKIMQKDFAAEIENHQLKHEIIATQITNFIVNRAGITFIGQICQDSGFGIVDVIKSFIITCDSFRIREIWEEIEKLDGKVAHHIQSQMFLSADKLLKRSVMWLLRNQTKGSLSTVVARFRKIADELSSVLPQVLAQASKESYERKVEIYRLNNVDSKLAKKVAALDPIASAFDIAEISAASNFDLKTIAKIYFNVGTRFSLKWLRSKVANLALDSYWQNLSSKTITEDLYSYQALIAKKVVEFNCSDKNLCDVNSVESWAKNLDFLVDRFDNFISDLKNHPNPDLSVFVVALNRLKPLVK